MQQSAAEAAVAPELEIQETPVDRVEALSEELLTEVTSVPKAKRLPPPPPLRSAASDGEEVSGRRKLWWEEVFNEDFDRSNPKPNEQQLAKEVAFIEDMLAVERGGAVLDLACGDGLYSVALGNHGYSVVGLDVSAYMLGRASERALTAVQGVKFTQGDMRELTYNQQFDGILCWNASFGYFEREKNLAVLRGAYQALKPGGSLLLDLPNRDFVLVQQPSQNWFEGDGCVCMDDMQLDFITSRLHVKRTIMLDDGRNRELYYSMRVYSLHELGRLVQETGFRVTKLSGSVTTPGVFFGSTSPRLIVLMTRPEQDQPPG